MKRIITILASVLLISGCIKQEVVEQLNESGYPIFTAAFEEAITKTFLDENHKLLWNAEDELTIFTTTYNQQYKFTGETGKNSGSFQKINSGEFVTGNAMSANYAVYPYLPGNEISNDEVISLSLPAVQAYGENSFGPGANTMVAVTSAPDDYFLSFKNLCGYLVVKLYGEGTVKSLSLKGNDGEKIAGAATVIARYDENPEITMSEKATDCITLDCGEEGVVLGTTADNATEFWFCIPPVTFSQGFTVTTTDTGGWSMVKSVSSSKTIVRNLVNTMPATETKFDTKDGFVYFEDPIFKAYCVKNFDSDGDKEISCAEAEEVKTIDVQSCAIKSLKGIECFTALTELNCSQNQLTSLDISNSADLTSLDCGKNQLTSLDVSNNTALTCLLCGENPLTNIDIRKNILLDTLNCWSSRIESLDVSKNIELKQLVCGQNPLYTLDVSHNIKLIELICRENGLTELDLNNNTQLVSLQCQANHLTSLDVSKNPLLSSLLCYNNMLHILDVRNNKMMITLWCDNNNLSEIDVKELHNLHDLGCSNNNLQELDISNNTQLESMNCTSNPKLKTIYVQEGFDENDYPEYRKDDSAQYVVKKKVKFEDDIFKSYCIENFDTNKDGEISEDEAAAVTSISISTDNVYSLKGIEYFTNLLHLDCGGSWHSESGRTVFDGQLTSLDVSMNVKLKSLICNHGQITDLDITSLKDLQYLNCEGNKLSSLDVSNNIFLSTLICQVNNISSLNVSNNPDITFLCCDKNPIEDLDIKNLKKLNKLECNNMKIKYLDLSSNRELSFLFAGNNPDLAEIWLSDGQIIDTFNYDQHTEIKYVGHLYAVDLGLNVKWASFNIGASAPWEYGNALAWGETETKSDFSWEQYKWCNGTENSLTKYNTEPSFGTVDNKTILDPDDDAAYVNWGNDWRTPSKEEWQELNDNCDFIRSTVNGVEGDLVISRINHKMIFLPACGFCFGKSVSNIGQTGDYWHSSINPEDPRFAYYNWVNYSSLYVNTVARCDGKHVRPVCN